MSQEFAVGESSVLRERDPCESAIVREAVREPIDSANACYHRLMQILSWKRPFDSDAEELFARHYIDGIPDSTQDAFGNRHVYVPYEDDSQCKVLWSSHIDTCHHDEGYQRLSILKDKDDIPYVGVRRGEGNCLGADDGTGVWLMLEMIAKRRPGYYLFHRGEERGCLGSKWIKDNKPDLLKHFNAAIALDRKGFDNIITHMGGERGCSQAFADGIGAQLTGYKADPTGALTDTKQYFGHIAECTNLSVGYEGQHGPLEKQYLGFALALRTQLIGLDTRKLPIERDPKKMEYRATQTYNYKDSPHHWLNDATAMGHNPISHDKLTYVWCYETRQDILRANAEFIKGRGFVLKEQPKAAADGSVEGEVDTTPQPKRLLSKEEAEEKWEAMADDSAKSMGELVKDYPLAIAKMLLDCGYNTFDLLCAIHGEDNYLTFSLEEDEAEEEIEAGADAEGDKPVMPRHWE